MFVESRGRLNIATCFVFGSIETTISVSVLYVPVARPLVRADQEDVQPVRAVPRRDRRVGQVRALDAAAAWRRRRWASRSARRWARLEAPATADGDGAGRSRVRSIVSAMKTHGSLRTSFASRSYRATTAWPPAITRITASSPAIETGLKTSRGRPSRPPPLAASALRKTVTRYASMIATSR